MKMVQEFCRLVSLVTDICGEGIRDALQELYKNDGCLDFQNFLESNLHILFHLWKPDDDCCTCSYTRKNSKPALSRKQWDKFFVHLKGYIRKHKTSIGSTCPCKWMSNPTASVNDLDITMSCLLIKAVYLGKLSGVQSRALDFIQTERNDLAHAKHTEITESEFQPRWDNLVIAVKDILTVLPADVKKLYEVRVDQLATKTLDPENCDRLVSIVKNLSRFDLEEFKQGFQQEQLLTLKELEKSLTCSIKSVVESSTRTGRRTDIEFLISEISNTNEDEMPVSFERNISRYAVGIDLGTTNTCVAVYQHGQCEVIANDLGKRLSPSYVSFTENKVLVGESAKWHSLQDPSNSIFDAKRLIGRRFPDPLIESDRKMWPFTVTNKSGKPLIQVKCNGQEKLVSSEEMSALILAKAKNTAESFIGGIVRDAIITVPAYFNSFQRQATKEAGRRAGFHVLRIINEPTAAAIAYLHREKDAVAETSLMSSEYFNFQKPINKRILVFDLGGGTLDVSILSCQNEKYSVLATSGDTHLGGKDIDDVLMEYCKEEIERRFDKQVDFSRETSHRLRAACEEAKITLSEKAIANIEVFNEKDVVIKITRARFNDLISFVFKTCLKSISKAISDADMDKSDINEILLVGGSTRIPKLRKVLIILKA